MHTPPIPRLLLCALLLLGASIPLRAAIDTNTNGVSDLWEARCPAAAEPHVDLDGDELSNRQEGIAGTDPTNAASRRAAG